MFRSAYIDASDSQDVKTLILMQKHFKIQADLIINLPMMQAMRFMG